jgi:hypothetical protein
LDNIVQYPHHGYGLFLAEALGLETLYELQGVEVMIAGAN